jgi:hypothetical protein
MTGSEVIKCHGKLNSGITSLLLYFFLYFPSKLISKIQIRRSNCQYSDRENMKKAEASVESSRKSNVP